MRRILFLTAFVLLSACSSPAVPAPPNTDVTLQPYLTSTPAPTGTPDILVVLETATPTNTPQVYVIQRGDTFSQIAEKFRVSQDALRAANPDLNPNILTIGDSIFIPDPASSAAIASTPTPVPAPVTQAVCHPTADSGYWCFALIQNTTADYLENVSAQINLRDAGGNLIASQTAFTPLDVITPNTSLPVYVFFPNVSQAVNPQVQVLTAMQTNASRYLPAVLNNTSIQISQDGMFAQVSGEVSLPAESTAATQVWVAAVAYDENGIVVGVRRWEGGSLQPGAVMQFQVGVASTGGVIEAVGFAVQAR